MKRKLFQNKSLVLMFFILVLASLLRLWHYNDRFGIGYDGSRDAIVAFESAKQRQLPLTGSFSSIAPITFGPLYYYYSTLSTILIPSSWAPWFSISFASVMMCAVMFRIGALLKDKKYGLLLAFLTSISPAQISASTLLQQHSLIGPLTSLIYLFTILLYNKPVPINFFTLGFLLGFSFNTHFQTISFILLPILLFFFIKRKRNFLWLFVGIMITMIPLLVFELNNHWFNTRHIIDYILFGQYRVWTSNRWLTFIGNFWPTFWSFVIGTPFVISVIIMFFSGIIISYHIWKRKTPLLLLLILIMFILQVVLLRYYRGEKFFGYLQFFHPIVIMLSGYLLLFITMRFKNPFAHLLFAILVLLIIFPYSASYLHSSLLTVDIEKRVKILSMRYPNQKIATFECSSVYEREKIQALLFRLYTSNMYEENGVKIGISSPDCPFSSGKRIDNILVDLNSLNNQELKQNNLKPITPEGIFEETARWWFTERP